MKRRFFRGFKVRIPRKLKKAAKYGVIIRYHRWYSYDYDYPDGYEGERLYVVIGRHNKWKEKVLSILNRGEGFPYVETWW